jgi:hypothetical protein
VERVKEAIWLLSEEQYLAIIGKVVMAQKKEFFLNRFWRRSDCGYDGGWPTTKNLLDSLIKQSSLE